MIDVRELRLKSLVALTDFDGAGIEIGEIGKDFVKCVNGAKYSLEMIKPIPLTEEWLVDRFGFEKVKVEDQDSDDIFYLLKGQTDWWIRFWNEYYYFSEEDFGMYDPFKTYSLIGAHQYVHQLQNLVLDLTGEELNLK